MPISAARFPVAEKLSSPPLALRVSFSDVPMSIENGAGLSRSNRTRVPLAVVVNCSAPLPPLTSTVSVPAPPSLRSVSSPGFQTMRSLPLCPKAWSSASPPVRVSFSSPPNSRSKPPLPSWVSLPVCPNSWSLPEPPVSTSLPAPPNRFAFGSAPLTSLSVITSLPPCPKAWMSEVLATVGVPPATVTAPPLTRIWPAALRLIVIELSRLSPNTEQRAGIECRSDGGARRHGRTRERTRREHGDGEQAARSATPAAGTAWDASFLL